MHRPSGVDLPDSPIGHHWMDVTHVSFGVATLGLVAGPVKLDASAFNGREPDLGKVEAGYVWDVRPRSHLVPGLGLAAGVHFLPEFLEPDYGRRPLSLLVFVRLKLR